MRGEKEGTAYSLGSSSLTEGVGNIGAKQGLRGSRPVFHPSVGTLLHPIPRADGNWSIIKTPISAYCFRHFLPTSGFPTGNGTGRLLVRASRIEVTLS